MSYIRTKDRIITSNKATHELIENICDAGYGKTLKKGAYVRIDKEWFNFYGRWVDLIDENGCHYSIRPSEVEKVTKELPQADTIEELCDRYIIQKRVYTKKRYEKYIAYRMKKDRFYPRRTRQEIILEINDYDTIYGAIWTNKGLIYVAKMNDKGELELL